MTKTITITSKRQLTIPRSLWDELQLDGVRYLSAEVHQGELKLKKIDFESRMSEHWNQNRHSVKGKVLDDSIRQTIRQAHSRKQL